MTATELQTQLFASVRSRLTNGASLPEEVAAALGISTDSAYRRIRGEKPVSLDELHTLCTRYNLSLDALLNLNPGTVTFQGRYVDPLTFRFEDYLTSVGAQVGYMARHRQRDVHYLCKDIPLFHHYHSKPLAAFKYFFWHRTMLQSPAYASGKIFLRDYPDAVYALGRAALDLYNQVDSFEIWNMESINGTLRQVEYYHDTKVFGSTEDLRQVYEALDRLFLHLERQAEHGRKFDPDNGQEPLGAYHMYYNEVVIGDNSLLAVLDGVKHAFLTHTGINFLLTRDLAFCENMYAYYQNLMRKSTLISTVSERERARFFRVLRKRIAARVENLGNNNTN